MAHGGGHTNQASVYPARLTNPSVHLSPANLTLSRRLSSRLALRLICLIRQRPSFLPLSPSAPAGALPTTVVRRRRMATAFVPALRGGGRTRSRASGRGRARATNARPAAAPLRYRFVVAGAMFQIRLITIIMRRGESIRGNGERRRKVPRGNSCGLEDRHRDCGCVLSRTESGGGDGEILERENPQARACSPRRFRRL